MAAAGRKPTAAMPQPEQHAYTCSQCPPGPDGKPQEIDGGSSATDAVAALEQHLYLRHTEVKAKVAFSRRPYVPKQRRQ